eukprot:scaffold26810_cov142-Skeletonema_marinoi.AAC.5
MFSISTVVGGVVEERALMLLLLSLFDAADDAALPPSLSALGRPRFRAALNILQCAYLFIYRSVHLMVSIASMHFLCMSDVEPPRKTNGPHR